MRFRPLAALSFVALSAVLLAGCSGSGSTTPTDDVSPTATAAPVDLCDAAAPSGDAVDAITVEGSFGEPSTVSATDAVDITEEQTKVVVEGTGDPVASGDYVTFAYSAFDPTPPFASLGSLGYTEGELAPLQISPDSPLGTVIGCATVGSRIVAAIPADETAGIAAQILVLDVLDANEKDPTCPVSEPQGAFPTVAVTDGVPVITVPAGDPPADVQIQVLEKGDGATVAEGDQVEVDYLGVKWSDGSEFDSSYSRGEPASFATTGVVTGFRRALEGQTVGTTLLVTMSPACGYGLAGSSSNELAGETLVFYVDILGATTQ